MVSRKSYCHNMINGIERIYLLCDLLSTTLASLMQLHFQGFYQLLFLNHTIILLLSGEYFRPLALFKHWSISQSHGLT